MRHAGVGASPVALVLRARIVRATAYVVAAHGFKGASLALVCERAGVSRRALREGFEDIEACMAAVLEQAVRHEEWLVARAFAGAERWEDGLRGALLRTLEFLDTEPELARTVIVEALAAGPAVLAVRERVAGRFRASVVERIEGDVPFTWPLAAEAMFASVMGIVHAHLVARDPQPLVGLLAPLMATLLAPFSDARELGVEVAHSQALAHALLARREREGCAGARARHSRWAGPELPAAFANPRSRRIRECLSYVAAHAGASNGEIARGIGVAHSSQISSLLTRLAGEGLLVKSSCGAGRPNGWWLTPHGQEAATLLRE